MHLLPLLLATITLGVLLVGTAQLRTQRPVVVQSWQAGQTPRDLPLEVVTERDGWPVAGRWANRLQPTLKAGFQQPVVASAND